MKKLLVLLMTALMLVSMVACETKPKGEQVIRVAIGDEPNIPDPAIATDNVSFSVLAQIYYGLFELDTIGNVVLTGCKSYDVSDDGLVYTFVIKDMKWSDGVKVTADHFVYGMKRSVGMGNDVAYYNYFIGNYVAGPKTDQGKSVYDGKDIADMVDLGIKVIDEDTFEITLEKPVPFFPSLMTSSVFYPLRPEVAPEHDSTWAYSVDAPVNGPFKPTKLDLTAELVFVPNEHFIDAKKVTLQSVTFIPMNDSDAQALAFEAGEIDIATRPSDSAIKARQGSKELVWAHATINYYFLINSADFTTAKALQDVRVRRALQLAIDREQLCEVMDVPGKFSPMYGYVPVGIPGAKGDFRSERDDVEKLVYFDQAEALALLAEAGYGPDNPLKLEYLYNISTMHDTASANIQAQLKEIGVEIHFRTADFMTVLTERDQFAKYELARGAMSADFMDPTTYLDMLATWSQQKVVINDAKYDGLLIDAQNEQDPVKRMEILHEAEDYLIRDMAYVSPLFFYDNGYFIKDGISGIGMDPAGGLRFAFVKMP